MPEPNETNPGIPEVEISFGVYWERIGDQLRYPFCPNCYEHHASLVRLVVVTLVWGASWRCRSCDTSFVIPPEYNSEEIAY